MLRAFSLGLVLLIGLLGFGGCSGEDDAATGPTPTTETRDDVDRAVTATVAGPAAGAPTAGDDVARTSGSGILAADGDFENGVRGWEVAAYGGAAGTISRTTTESEVGNASLALSVRTAGDVGAVLRGQLVPAGTPHTLTAWVKSPPGTSNWLRVIGSRGDRNVSPSVPGDGTWKEVVGQFETGGRETSIEIRLMQDGEPATSYFDAVQLQFRHGHAAVSNQTLLRRLDGTRIAVEGRIVTLDTATLACGGDGAGVTRGGERRWTHFTCVQPTFPPGSIVGPDVLFRVHVTSPSAVAITDMPMGG